MRIVKYLVSSEEQTKFGVQQLAMIAKGNIMIAVDIFNNLFC